MIDNHDPNALRPTTPRKAVQIDDLPTVPNTEELPPLTIPEPERLPLTWKDRFGAMIAQIVSPQQTLSLHNNERTTMNTRTTWVGIIKVMMGLLGTILAGSGIDVTGGTLTVASGTAPFVIAALIGYFVLSGAQAYLTQDHDGGTGKTTVVGIIKSASGVLATVLLALGLEISPEGMVAFNAGMTIWVIVLYLAYLILSAVQAVLTKDRPEVGSLKFEV